MAKFNIYTDGSCFHNGFQDKQLPYGGWAFCVFLEEGNELIFEDSGGEFPTTNNKMEIEALKQSFLWIKKHDAENFNSEEQNTYEIFLDSEYVVKSILFYVKKWAMNDWKRKDGGEVKNLEMWKELYDLYYTDLRSIKINITWIKGHSDDMNNNLVDVKAREAADKYKKDNLEKYEELNKANSTYGVSD